jgi:cation:H+ antiporter
VALNLAQLIVGLAGLVIGGNWLVSGATRLAVSFGIPTLIIGLTVVAFGTSSPELLVNISAATSGASDLAVGNILGSNIANIGLILGITGFIAPITLQSILVRREIPLMILASAVTFGLAADGLISRWDGVLLMAGFVAFNLLMVYLTVRGNSVADGEAPPARNGTRQAVLRLLVGIALLVVGAQWTVDGASSIARGLGVSELAIGISLVAVGTSLPELSASVIAAMRQENDLTVGNVVGSNIVNLLGILGLVAIFQPIAIAPEAVQIDFPVMLAFAFLVLPFAWTASRLSRPESLLFLAGYAAFIVFTFLR